MYYNDSQTLPVSISDLAKVQQKPDLVMHVRGQQR